MNGVHCVREERDVRHEAQPSTALSKECRNVHPHVVEYEPYASEEMRCAESHSRMTTSSWILAQNMVEQLHNDARNVVDVGEDEEETGGDEGAKQAHSKLKHSHSSFFTIFCQKLPTSPLYD